MLVGVPKEIKDSEYRVGLVPSTVRELTSRNHRVLVQRDAGLGAGIPDDAYVAAGAEIAPGPDPIFAEAELIVKVKEPLAVERRKLRCISPPTASRPRTSSSPASSPLPTRR
jgi:alanine dehydrogenase